jgi:hypothetical protein
MKRLIFVFLTGCGTDVFIPALADGEAGIDVDPPTEDAGIEASSEASEVKDASKEAIADVESEDALMCGIDGGSCTSGSCCAGLHCFSGKCVACKPDGVIAIAPAECCNPSGFANSVCGGVKTCAAPNYDKCGPSNNGLSCCGGAACKQNGQVWSCACGPIDAPCHVGNGFECCSGICDSKGWCT